MTNPTLKSFEGFTPSGNAVFESWGIVNLKSHSIHSTNIYDIQESFQKQTAAK